MMLDCCLLTNGAACSRVCALPCRDELLSTLGTLPKQTLRVVLIEAYITALTGTIRLLLLSRGAVT